MNILLWSLQVILAVINALHGWMFATWSAASDERMQKRRPGMKPLGLSPGFRTFIGVVELLAAPGLILPGLLGIQPWLTPLAAAGFAVIMAGSVVYHLRRQETSNVVGSAVICAVSAFVAYMRWYVVPL